MLKRLTKGLAKGVQPDVKEVLARVAKNEAAAIDFDQRGLTAADMEALCSAIGPSRTVKTLTLAGNNIGGRGAHQLAELVSASSVLTSLNLNANVLGDRGAEQLAHVLPLPPRSLGRRPAHAGGHGGGPASHGDERRVEPRQLVAGA